MKGLELSRAYWANVGGPALAEAFPDLFPRMSFGLAGEGSECFGFDDEVSKDHDWGPAFCIWLEEQDYRLFGGAVQRCYCQLPQAYLGFGPRKETSGAGERVGCLSIQRWFLKYTGTPLGPQTLEEWRKVPESFLATAVNGEIFSDPLGLV